MTYSKNKLNTAVKDLKQSIIDNYFATINKEEFEQTATLFAEDGELLAPFEKPIIGRDAIALYLNKQAKGMKLLPQTQICELTDDNTEQIKVTGKVQTSLFTVNVAWFFDFNSEQKITRIKIKLLASPQELLELKVISNE